MTQAEWLACTATYEMSRFLEGKATLRKWRLVAVACLRRVVSYRTVQVEFDNRSEPDWRAIIKVVEEFIEGRVDETRLARAHQTCRSGVFSSLTKPAHDFDSSDARLIVHIAAIDSRYSVPDYEVGSQQHRFYCAKTEAPRNRAQAAEERAQCDIFRCVFGHIFSQDSILNEPIIKPVLLQWNDGIVRKIAQAIYDDRAFDHMPILADALEDAGCDNADMLMHCRSGGEHVRGCWVVDLLLGKS